MTIRKAPFFAYLPKACVGCGNKEINAKDNEYELEFSPNYYTKSGTYGGDTIIFTLRMIMNSKALLFRMEWLPLQIEMSL